MFIKHFPRKKTFLPLNDYHRNPLKNIPTSLRNSNMSKRKESNHIHRISQILFSLSQARQVAQTHMNRRDAYGPAQKPHISITTHFQKRLWVFLIPRQIKPEKNHRGHYFLMDDPLLKMDCKNFRHDWIYYWNTELAFEKDKINVYKWRTIIE